MWQFISNIASIITCVLFIFYIVGHIWKIFDSKNNVFEKFNFVSLKEKKNLIKKDDLIEDVNYFNFSKENGRILSIVSSSGINKLSIYSLKFNGKIEDEFLKDKLLKNIYDIKSNQEIYIKVDFIDLFSNVYIEIERKDYVIESFVVACDGKDGDFIKLKNSFQLTFKSVMYYLCS